MEDSNETGGNRPTNRTFEDVFLPHLNAAYNLAHWILRNEQDAQDCVQDAYLRAYKAYPRFRGDDGKAWLMTIVRNVCHTAIAKSRSRRAPESFDEEIHQPREPEADDFGRKATAETLRAGMDQLTPEYREVIVLHDLEGHSYRDIATIAGVPIGTVMSRLARARDKLRALVMKGEMRHEL